MGCDIHMFVERREGGAWVTADKWHPDPENPGRMSIYKWGEGLARLAGPIYSDRNYDLFAILANVRNGRGFAGCDTGDGFVPIAKPRGVPEDACSEYQAAVEDWAGDGHSHSYFTVAELLAYDWTQTTKHRGWVSEKEYIYYRLTGKPKIWSGGVDGPSIVHLSNEEMEVRTLRGAKAHNWVQYHNAVSGREQIFTQVEWEAPYYESCSRFLSHTMPKLWRLGKPEDVRVLFFFDN